MTDMDDIDNWSALLRVLTYGIIMTPDPLAHVDRAIASAVHGRTHYGSPEEFLQAIRNALAHEGDLAELLFQEHPDTIVRSFLRAVEQRLLQETRSH